MTKQGQGQQQPPPTPEQQSSVAPVLVSVSFGIAVGAAAALYATRKTPHADRRLLMATLQELRANIQKDTVSEIRESLEKTTMRLQSHEREIMTRLQPVAAVPTHLASVHQRLDDVASIFTNVRGRGTFGEIQLETLIRDAFAVGSFDFQITLSNNRRVDCLLHLPPPIGALAVDAKFPLEAFRPQQQQQQQLTASGSTQQVNGFHPTATVNNTTNLKAQKDSLRKHIRDIAEKYIIPGETADSAILFLPSESIFMQVVEHHDDVLLEANRKKVWITCPTTLHAILTVLQGATRGMSIQQHSQELPGTVQKMTQDMNRMLERYQLAVKSVDKAKEELRRMNVSIEKVQKSRDKLEAMGVDIGMNVTATPPPTLAAATTTTNTSDLPSFGSGTGSSVGEEDQQIAASSSN